MNLFDLQNYGAQVKTEFIAGISIFLASFYIILTEPQILAETGMPFSAVLTSTILVSAFSSILMGLYANNPVLVAPGMSINSLFVYISVNTLGMNWAVALGIIFWSGVLFLIFSIIDKNQYFIRSIPRPLRTGVAGGIGLYIAFLGLEDANIISGLSEGDVFFFINDISMLLFLFGIALMSVLIIKKTYGAYLIGVLAVSVIAYILGVAFQTPSVDPGSFSFTASPDFSLIGQVDIIGALSLPFLPILVMFLVIMYVDNICTLIALSEASNVLDEDGNPHQADKSLQAIGTGIVLSSVLGTSSVTAYMESAAGILQNGRTGLTALVAGLCFLPFLFFSPVLSLIPPEATGPVLVISGVVMLWPVAYVRWDRLDDSIPLFVSLISIPFTGSIALGVIFGSLTWTAIRIGRGKWNRIPIMLWIIDIIGLIYIAL